MKPPLRHKVFLWIMVGVLIYSFLIAWAWSEFRESARRDVRNAHQQSVQTCISLNELRRQFFLYLIDQGESPRDAKRFLPTERCERLP